MAGTIVNIETLFPNLLGTYKNLPLGSQRTWNELLPDPNEPMLANEPLETFTVNAETVSDEVFAA